MISFLSRLNSSSSELILINCADVTKLRKLLTGMSL